MKFQINKFSQISGCLLVGLGLLACHFIQSGISSCQAAVASGAPTAAVATMVCPFCTAVAPTMSEQIATSDVVVLATLENQPQQDLLGSSEELPRGQFKVKHILTGDKFINIDEMFETVLVGRYDQGTTFMVVGVDAPDIAWSTPVKMSERAQEYIRDVVELPEGGPERLVFFQDFLQDEETILAYDAYDEFARAPYADMIAMKDQMDHDQVIEWLKDIEIPTNRKRLYYVMLGICGNDMEDVQLLEDILRSDDADRQKGLDACVACYLNLKGPKGLDLIDEVFLTDRDKDYVEVFSVVSALRFHGAEEDVIPRDRLLQSMRLVLERPDMADMIIPDLARWEDWSVTDRLFEIFKSPTEETSDFIRMPIASYMLACPKDEAKKYLEEMRKVDAMTVSRAEKILQWELGFLDDEDEDDEEGEQDKVEGEQDKEKDGDKSRVNPFDRKDKISRNNIANHRIARAMKLAGHVRFERIVLVPGFDISRSLLSMSSSVALLNSAAIYFPQESTGAIKSQGSLAPGEVQASMLGNSGEELAAGSDDATDSFSDESKTPLDANTAPITVEVPQAESFVSTSGGAGSAGSGGSSAAAPDLEPGPPISTGLPEGGGGGMPGDANMMDASSVTNGEAESPSGGNAVVGESTISGPMILLVPFTCCVGLFLLSWSVINGWFERLIY